MVVLPPMRVSPTGVLGRRPLSPAIMRRRTG
nr:MAG TPA: hypothetical protein [Caudoviricetes sp.]